jgi:hypothetical protein
LAKRASDSKEFLVLAGQTLTRIDLVMDELGLNGHQFNYLVKTDRIPTPIRIGMAKYINRDELGRRLLE